MGVTFRADGTLGRVAMYEDSDDGPWSSPEAYPSRTLFHSSLGYLARIATITGTISLPARSPPSVAPFLTTGTASIQLAAHGRPGIPMIEGRFLGLQQSTTSTNGYEFTLAAAIPAAMGSVPVAPYRFLTLGANATHILVHDMWATSFGFAPGAQAVSYEVHILDQLFT